MLSYHPAHAHTSNTLSYSQRHTLHIVHFVFNSASSSFFTFDFLLSALTVQILLALSTTSLYTLIHTETPFHTHIPTHTFIRTQMCSARATQRTPLSMQCHLPFTICCCFCCCDNLHNFNTTIKRNTFSI